MIALDHEAHQLAAQFAKAHLPNIRRAKQVYLNTLCVCAVYDYLTQIGIEIEDLSNNESWDLVMQAMSNVADVAIAHQGQVECRPVFQDSTHLQIPPEVWGDRVAYLAVQFDKCCNELQFHELTLPQLQRFHQVKLLGFVEPIQEEYVPLWQLKPLEILVQRFLTVPETRPEFIPELVPETAVEPEPSSKVKSKPTLVPLLHWLQDIAVEGWHTAEELLGGRSPELAFQFRGASGLLQRKSINAKQVSTLGTTLVRRGRTLRLAPSTNDQILFFLGIAPDQSSHPEHDIWVEIYPMPDCEYLPPDLHLSILNEDDTPVLQAQAMSENPYLHFNFTGEPGEQFSIRLQQGEFSITESFLI